MSLISRILILSLFGCAQLGCAQPVVKDQTGSRGHEKEATQSQGHAVEQRVHTEESRRPATSINELLSSVAGAIENDKQNYPGLGAFVAATFLQTNSYRHGVTMEGGEPAFGTDGIEIRYKTKRQYDATNDFSPTLFWQDWGIELYVGTGSELKASALEDRIQSHFTRYGATLNPVDMPSLPDGSPDCSDCSSNCIEEAGTCCNLKLTGGCDDGDGRCIHIRHCEASCCGTEPL